jgi:hypothetical protein
MKKDPILEQIAELERLFNSSPFPDERVTLDNQLISARYQFTQLHRRAFLSFIRATDLREKFCRQHMRSYLLERLTDCRNQLTRIEHIDRLTAEDKRERAEWLAEIQRLNGLAAALHIESGNR